MSRNLAMTVCDRCHAPSVCLDEEARRITREEAGPYFGQFFGMKVANATCPTCDARYLAWCRYLPHREEWSEEGYVDLSYRSTFNDEAGPDDLPKPKVLVEMDWAIGVLEQHLPGRYDREVMSKVNIARDVLCKCLGWDGE